MAGGGFGDFYECAMRYHNAAARDATRRKPVFIIQRWVTQDVLVAAKEARVGYQPVRTASQLSFLLKKLLFMLRSSQGIQSSTSSVHFKLEAPCQKLHLSHCTDTAVLSVTRLLADVLCVPAA